MAISAGAEKDTRCGVKGMTKIIKEFEVEALPERVFRVVSVPDKWPQWCGFVKRASSNGSDAHWVYDMGGMKVESDSKVSELRENSVYEFRQTSGFMKSGATRFDIRPSEKGSKVIWTTEYELPFSYLGKIADKLKARRQFEQAIERALKSLIQFLER